MKISYLADHPQLIDTLAPLVWEHWRPILTQDTLKDRITKFRAHLNYHSLPVAWVAHSGTRVLGTAALRVHDLPGREDLTPWLSGVFVAPAFRRQGIGAELCKTVERHAREIFGVTTLYLFTLDQQTWYQSLGWELMQPCTWCGNSVDIMLKKMGSNV